MKKTALVLMAVMIATPCLAQEIERDGLFTIEGTAWEATIELQILPYPWIGPSEFSIGFWDGEIYPHLMPVDWQRTFYMDMLAASVFMYETAISPGVHINFGILQPVGIGMMVRYSITFPPYSGIFPSQDLSIMTLIKTEDPWSPPEEPVVE